MVTRVRWSEGRSEKRDFSLGEMKGVCSRTCEPNLAGRTSNHQLSEKCAPLSRYGGIRDPTPMYATYDMMGEREDTKGIETAPHHAQLVKVCAYFVQFSQQ